MSEGITKELRDYISIRSNGIGGECMASVWPSHIMAIADRIDERAVALPVDADGETWHIGDLVYDAPNECSQKIKQLNYCGEGEWVLVDEWDQRYGSASEFTHYKPTPAERIREWANHAAVVEGNLDDLLAIADELEGEDK